MRYNISKVLTGLTGNKTSQAIRMLIFTVESYLRWRKLGTSTQDLQINIIWEKKLKLAKEVFKSAFRCTHPKAGRIKQHIIFLEFFNSLLIRIMNQNWLQYEGGGG